MNEIPRRSFLALLGAAVVAVKLPTVPAAEPLAEIVKIESEPITVVRRWYITKIDFNLNRSKVQLSEAFVPEKFAAVVPAPTAVKYEDISTCSMERPFEHLMTFQGPVVQPLPAKAEIEVSLDVALNIYGGMANGRDFVEFVGDMPAV